MSDDRPIATEPVTETAPSAARTRQSPSRIATAVRLIGFILLVGVIWWAYEGIGFDFGNFKHGIAVASSNLTEMFPHSPSDRAEFTQTIKDEYAALISTLQMAIIGTVVGALLAFPVSFFAARTTSLFRPLSVAIKTVLNMGRAVPVMIYALLVVDAVGLGAPAGAVAISIGSFVMLAKLYAEGLESVTLGPVEAVKASGGNAIQTFVFGMLPQVFPNYLSATLYAFELNIGSSAILGIVGAGGLGFDLQNYIRLFRMLETGALILMLIVLVNCVDYLSYRIRQIFT